MSARNIAAVSLALTALALSSVPSVAGTCDGRVVGVRPISQYHHGSGAGFLAVRSGPGGKYRQVGEVYRGDWVEITDRRGNWYRASCQEGRCEDPLWGPSYPSGWVHRNYIRASGNCPR